MSRVSNFVLNIGYGFVCLNIYYMVFDPYPVTRLFYFFAILVYWIVGWIIVKIINYSKKKFFTKEDKNKK